MRKFMIEHKPEEWRFFIDGSNSSLKGVLLHNGNFHPSVPIVFSACLKENYANLKLILSKVNYNRHQWKFCGDFKVISIVLGLQGGYIKHPCFLCMWHSRKDEIHWEVGKDGKPMKLGERVSMKKGDVNMINEPLIDKYKVLLPPLHIKLRLMKQFVKALVKTNLSFIYIKNLFPKVSKAKIKGGIFVGPQIRKLMQDDEFIKILTPVEKKAWLGFKNVIDNFLGNTKDPKYEQIVSDMLASFSELGCRMSIKVYFLHAHLNYFPDNLGDFSEEHGERFHQDIKVQSFRLRFDRGGTKKSKANACAFAMHRL